MGKVIIMSETTDEPLTFTGFCAGICWGADTSNHEKNFKRGLECLRSRHMRTVEFPQIYMILDGWSARCIRELYTHIIDVTRLQASTRYVDYTDFKYFIPSIISNNPEARDAYEGTMDEIRMTAEYLEKDLGIKREDVANLLPLGMETKIVFRCGLRELINIMEQRLCMRAYHEIRELMEEIKQALVIYSDEWKYLIEEEKIFTPKCESLGYCPERYSCGRKIKKDDFETFVKLADYCHRNGIKDIQDWMDLKAKIEKTMANGG